MSIESISQLAARGLAGRELAAATPRPSVSTERREDRVSNELTSKDLESPKSPETKEEIESRVEAENARFAAINQQLTFRVHDGSGQIMVQVVDRNTGEVVNERPPQAFLDLVVRMREMVGAFLDETS